MIGSRRQRWIVGHEERTCKRAGAASQSRAQGQQRDLHAAHGERDRTVSAGRRRRRHVRRVRRRGQQRLVGVGPGRPGGTTVRGPRPTSAGVQTSHTPGRRLRSEWR